jgi:hypothetical protein
MLETVYRNHIRGAGYIGEIERLFDAQKTEKFSFVPALVSFR